jgi:hypothetical protein
MSSTNPGIDPNEGKDTATQDEERESSAADEGGALASEEDIGTEGEGTEPQESADVERDAGRQRSKPRPREDAP